MKRDLQGIGLGLRREFARELSTRLAAREAGAGADALPDFLEITPENWVCYGGKLRALLEQNLALLPSVPHSVSLDIGGASPLDPAFLDAVAALCERTGAPFFSDHVCYSAVRGQPVHDLLPLPLSREAAEHTARRCQEVRARTGLELVLENATFYAHMPTPPDDTLDEADFLRAILEWGGCGMLLDVNNVYVNAQNHGFDARAFIDRMPLERVRQLHVAGHTPRRGVVIDTHIGPVIEPVWDLYRHTLARAGRLIPTVIEWDQEIPALDQVLAEVSRARQAAAQALGAAATRGAGGAGAEVHP